jgi:cytochrome c oxidase subunit I
MLGRQADYAAQFTDFHAFTSVGAMLFGLTQVYWLLAIVIPNTRGGKPAPAKPCDDAEGLEWTVRSPAPFHMVELPPLVK